MSNDNVMKLIQPGIFADHLTEILRNGACALLTQAVEARHGRLPEREIMAGVGPVAVRQPRVRDR